MSIPLYLSIVPTGAGDEIMDDWVYESSDDAVLEVRGVTCGDVGECDGNTGVCIVEDPGCLFERARVNLELGVLSAGEANIVVRDGSGEVVDQTRIEVTE